MEEEAEHCHKQANATIGELEREIDKSHRLICGEQGAEGGVVGASGGLAGSNKRGGVTKDRLYDLRYRPAIHPPNRYGQCPILIRGSQGHYTPWQTLDLAGLISRLPDIHEGAGKWIKAFEEETVGKMLALGDIKAVWAQSLGVSTMENILRNSGNTWMANPMADGTELNAYRAELWMALRGEYPTKIDPKSLKGEPLAETENAAGYINKQLKRWKQETEEEAESSPVLMTLFRNAVIEALPTPVQSRLEDVVGLTSMPHRQFRDHVVHAIEKYRKDEEKIKEQERNLQRKLTQLQLTDLQNKSKIKTQAPMVNDTTNHAMPIAPDAQPSPVQPPAVVNVYSQQPNPQQRNGAMRPPFTRPRWEGQRGPPSFQNGQRRPPQRECWGCGDTGHFRANCPRPQPGTEWREGGRGSQSMQRGGRGPVNPWAGPKYGY